MTRGRRIAALVGVAWWLVSAPLSAHPLAPSLLEVRELGGDVAEVRWKTPLVAAPGVRLSPVLPSACSDLSSPVTSSDDLAVTTVWRIHCPGGLSGSRLGVDGLAGADARALLRLVTAGGQVEKLLSSHDSSLTVPRTPTPQQIRKDYFAFGLEHLRVHPEALVFLLGLLLLGSPRRALAAAVAGVTLGSCLTLTLAMLTDVALPPRPIELGIALGLFALAVAVVHRPRARAAAGLVVAAVGFGLLHGLACAVALRQLDLPAGELPLALLSFNAGIEMGQLALVALGLGAGAALARLPLALPRWMLEAPVYAIGSLAVLWSLQRTADLLS